MSYGAKRHQKTSNQKRNKSHKEHFNFTCARKIRYHDIEEAKEALKLAKFDRAQCERNGESTSHREVRYYLCECKGYHLTSKPRRSDYGKAS